jgi:ankyrin repeat protein
LLRFLVKELGADVNLGMHGVLAPVFITVLQCDLASLRCLVLELGADVNIISVNGMSPLFYAVDMNTAHDGAVSCLVGELGADVNQAKHDNGYTALLGAVDLGDLEVVRCLLKLRADINLADANGATPLMTASVKKHARRDC